jgi:hypothetical protein
VDVREQIRIIAFVAEDLRSINTPWERREIVIDDILADYANLSYTPDRCYDSSL